MENQEQALPDEIISGASNLFGAFTSASIAAVDPAMAATAGMAGVLAEETLRSLLTRALGYRDRRRVSAVVGHAQERVRVLQANGATIREDDFWRARGNIPPVGQEVFEAVLLAAQKEPQEQKIPYMGNLFAYIACRPEISDVSAHWLVKTAESLSWTQFELLALVNRIDEVDVEGMTVGEPALTWDSMALHRELIDLGDGEKRLTMGKTLATESMGLEFPSTKLADQTFTESGRLLVFALGIGEMKGPRLDDLVGRLRRPLDVEGKA
ncbi:hypothetical protein ACFRJ8_16325 [Arthrobacter sp. NPDC056886]|uniref:hypothetical protein n=1 Tax=Arthrobacter sp. NPDC056886 TaxID=3345960 RepID=UPI003670007D